MNLLHNLFTHLTLELVYAAIYLLPLYCVFVFRQDLGATW